MKQGIITLSTGSSMLGTGKPDFAAAEIRTEIARLNKKGITVVNVIPLSFSFPFGDEIDRKLVITKVAILYNE